MSIPVSYCTVCTLISTVDPEDEDDDAVHPDQPLVDAEGGDPRHHHHPRDLESSLALLLRFFLPRVCSNETLASFPSTFPNWISGLVP